ncbi:MAG: PleD family two-component system response regulator [Pseudomonadota bacterium]|jgi:CheY-like chemotaxis protein
MKNILARITNKFRRRRLAGEDTRRLPSLVKAMRALVPKAVMREVVASSHDRRQWGVLAAAWVGVSEREFVNAAARELRMPYQDHVAVPDMTVFGANSRPMLAALRKVGATVQLEGQRIVCFIATDPAEIRGLDFFDGTQNISMAPWTEIARALDMAERLVGEAEANNDRALTIKRKELCQKVISLLIQEALQHGASGLEILSSDGKSRYQFSTVEGRVAVGAIHPEVVESLLLHLHGIDGDVFDHASVGKVLVRSLGSSSNMRLSWKANDIPVGIAWSQAERVPAPLPPSATEALMPHTRSIQADGDDVGDIPVLVVDDNPMFCRMVERLLIRDGFQVSLASNGRAALELLVGQLSVLPKVIICDLHMPEMNGKEFVEHLRSDTRLCYIPVIMLTSDDGVEAEVSALETGADALVSKTKDSRVLCAQVVRLAKKRSLKEAA